MICAYNESYLNNAMKKLGVMFDFGINYSGDPKEEFWTRFAQSGLAGKSWRF